MDRIKLASHVKKGDTLYTPYTEPDGLGKTLKITSWSKSWLPEFMWIGLIISELGRKQGLEQLYKIIDELQENKICVPYFFIFPCVLQPVSSSPMPCCRYNTG